MRGKFNGRVVKGVIFDLDGTLTKSPLDFKRIKEKIGCPEEKPVLEYINLLEEEEKERALNILISSEINAAKKSELYPGAREVINYLKKKEIKIAIVTRNSKKAVDIVLSKHKLFFDALITREVTSPKPSAKPLIMASELLGIDKENLIMVGDYKYDLMASRKAGIRNILVMHEEYCQEFKNLADWTVNSLTEIIKNLDFFPCHLAGDVV